VKVGRRPLRLLSDDAMTGNRGKELGPITEDARLAPKQNS